jgi:hypothetical protein
VSDEERIPAASSEQARRYAYPADLARLVGEACRDGLELPGTACRLPGTATLEEFLSACYQASLLREEARPVTFRAILAAPTLFVRGGRPPAGLQLLEFSRPLPFHPGELRRLSIAAESQRTLIGVGREEDGSLRIWGMINSGTRWQREVRGGRQAGAPLPLAPVVHVDAAGHLSAYIGDNLVGSLHGGELSGARLDVFRSAWLPELFIAFRGALVGRHEAARVRARELLGEKWAMLEPSLPRRITERLHKRVVALLREAHQGGTLLFIPEAVLSREIPYIDFRCRFADDARSCLPDLIVDILNHLARLYGVSEPHRLERVGWREFESTTDDGIATLDEALFEMAHLFAGLAAADGALVETRRHELVGFGGMISGRLPEVGSVWRALDLEGVQVVEEDVGNVGARHRAAYRLVAAIPDAVAIVISQDGGARFVVQRDSRVTYWEQD